MSKPSEAKRPQSRRSPRRRPSASRQRVADRQPHEAARTSESRFVDDARKQRSARRQPTSQSASATPAASATSRRPGGATRWDIVKPHIRRFGPPLAINHALTVGIFLAIAVVVGIGAGFSRVPATVASLWMVANLGSLNMTGAVLGFVPLLPALIMVWAHARRMTKTLGSSVSVRGLRVFVGLALAIPLLLTLIAWLMLWDASRVFDMAAPDLLDALVSTAIVNGAAIVLGMRARIWRALLLRREWPTWPVEAFRLAARFLRGMLLVGLAACLIYIATNFSAVMRSYDITRNLMGATGLTVVALMYLPNFAIGALAVLMGGEFHVGDGVVTLFTSSNVNLPPLPTMAAVPHDTLPAGPLYMLVTAAVAVWTVYRFIARREFMEAPVATAVGSGAAAAFLAFCLSWLGGGEMGVYGAVGALGWLAAAEAAAWLMLPALVVMLYASRKGAAVREDVAVTAAGGEEPSPSDSGYASASRSTPSAEPSTASDTQQAHSSAADSAAEMNPAEEDAAGEGAADAGDSEAEKPGEEMSGHAEDRPELDGSDADSSDLDGTEDGVDGDGADSDSTDEQRGTARPSNSSKARPLNKREEEEDK